MRRRYSVDICPIAKKRTYLSYDDAEQWCFDEMTPYRCDSYPHWHVGHIPFWKRWWLESSQNANPEEVTAL